MARIDARLENWKETYDEVECRRQSRRFAIGFSAVLNCVYQPNVLYLPGAEEEIEEVCAQNRPIIYALNHISRNDPNVGLAASYQQRSLRARIGRMHVLAKSPLFQGGRLNPIPALTMAMGGIPVYRKKDHLDADTELLQEAGDRMLEISARALMKRDDVVIFPEGTCNEGDPRRLQPVGVGMAHIAHQAVAWEQEEHPDDELGLMFLPIGISYGVTPLPGQSLLEFWRTRHASVCFGRPVRELQKLPFQTKQVVKAGMQAVLTAAHEDYYERRGQSLDEIEEWRPAAA